MTGSEEVLLEVDGGVAIVTLNAPDRRNALTPTMASELIGVFDEVDGRSDVGATARNGRGPFRKAPKYFTDGASSRRSSPPLDGRAKGTG